MTTSPLERKNRILSALWVCLAAMGLTALVLGAVYALRGIWPFGTDNVAYMDAAQFYVPNYYSLWDSLHGDLSGGAWRQLLYPYNWPFYFVARDHVLEAMSLYLAIRMLLVALFAAVALCWRFPRLSGVWKTVFALLYAFSGFVLQYYSNFGWLTAVTVFPLLLLGLERLLREGKCGLYTAMYAYFLYMGVYYAYMATVYILLFALGYILLVLPKDRRGGRAFRLGVSTALALGICSRRWLRNSAALAGGARFQENLDSGLLSGMTTWNIPNTRHTFLMLMGMSLIAALFLLALLRQRTAPRSERKRAIRFFGYMLGLFALPMVFTNIDTAWHFGQYNFFPMRYGYMLPATLIAGGCLALEDETRTDAAPLPSGVWRLPWGDLAAGICGAVGGLLVLIPPVQRALREYGACFLNTLGAAGYWRWFAMYAAGGIMFTALYLLLRALPPKRAAWAVLAAVLLQLGANAWGSIAPNDDHTYTHEYDPAYIDTAERLHDYFAAQPLAPLERVKNVDNSLNAGYPAVAGVSALSSIDSNASAGKLGVFEDLGYTVNYFRILDTGGTVFTDMLLNVDRVLSASALDGDLYLSGDTVDGVQAGFSRYPGVLGLMYDADALDGYFDLTTLADRLNALYGAFTGSDAPLAHDLAPEMSVSGEGMRAYTLTCRLDRPAFVYMAVDGVAMNIAANGKAVTAPSYRNLNNTVYPAPFNSNLLCLGLFEAGDAEISFASAMELAPSDVTLLGLDKGLLDSFRADADLDEDMTLEKTENGYTVTVAAQGDGKRLFLPIMDPVGWQCTVNGEETALSYFIGVMTSVPLRAGENTVVLTRGGGSVSTLGRALPWLCLVLAAGWLVLCRRRRSESFPPRWAGSASLALFYAAAAAVVCFVYIAPTVLLIVRGTVVWF